MNAERVPDPVRCWAEEVKDMLFVFDEAPADEVLAAIYEYGYVRGMEKILFTARLKPFNTLASLVDSASAWGLVKDAFIVRCVEAKKNGFE